MVGVARRELRERVGTEAKRRLRLRLRLEGRRVVEGLCSARALASRAGVWGLGGRLRGGLEIGSSGGGRVWGEGG